MRLEVGVIPSSLVAPGAESPRQISLRVDGTSIPLLSIINFRLGTKLGTQSVLHALVYSKSHISSGTIYNMKSGSRESIIGIVLQLRVQP